MSQVVGMLITLKKKTCSLINHLRLDIKTQADNNPKYKLRWQADNK